MRTIRNSEYKGVGGDGEQWRERLKFVLAYPKQFDFIRSIETYLDGVNCTDWYARDCHARKDMAPDLKATHGEGIFENSLRR